jgi:hypothetical protein
MVRVYAARRYGNVAGSSRRSDEAAQIRLTLPSSDVPNESPGRATSHRPRDLFRDRRPRGPQRPIIRSRTDDQSGDAVILLGLDEKLRRGAARPGDLWLTCSLTPLLIEMPELGTLDAGQVASLASPSPVTRQSGRWTGRAFIRGGRAGSPSSHLHATLVATCFNPDMTAKYNQLTNAGKPAKVALTAGHTKADCPGKKQIVLANGLLKPSRSWTPKPA